MPRIRPRQCSRRRVRPSTLATYRSSIRVFHWQGSALRLGFGAPPRLPSLQGFPDLLDGQRLDGQGLCPLDVALAYDGAEGGFFRRVKLLPDHLPIQRVRVLRRAVRPVGRWPANIPGQPLHTHDLEAAWSMSVRIDLNRLPEPEPELAEVEGVQVLVARNQPGGGVLPWGRPRMLPPRGGRGKFLGPRHVRNECSLRLKKTCPPIVLAE